MGPATSRLHSEALVQGPAAYTQLAFLHSRKETIPKIPPHVGVIFSICFCSSIRSLSPGSESAHCPCIIIEVTDEQQAEVPPRQFRVRIHQPTSRLQTFVTGDRQS